MILTGFNCFCYSSFAGAFGGVLCFKDLNLHKSANCLMHCILASNEACPVCKFIAVNIHDVDEWRH